MLHNNFAEEFKDSKFRCISSYVTCFNDYLGHLN